MLQGVVVFRVFLSDQAHQLEHVTIAVTTALNILCEAFERLRTIGFCALIGWVGTGHTGEKSHGCCQEDSLFSFHL